MKTTASDNCHSHLSQTLSQTYLFLKTSNLTIAKMHFSQLITALAFTTLAGSSIASEVIPAVKQNCITVGHLEAAHEGLTILSNKFKFPFPEDFPNVKEFLDKDTNSCVHKSVSDVASDVMNRIGKEHDFESKLAEVEAQGIGRVPSTLAKRIRTCPDIKEKTKQKAASTWSCQSARNPGKCDACTNRATAFFITGVAVCMAKNEFESLSCCAAAAIAFLTKYSEYCLEM